ncbi:MAG TPA: FAD-dependent oxidoreductase [Streptosporangiaceae bacterium]|nr:FAD-dependent oxidoreductase [Streptosporangiaceae bacterium]
MTRRVVVVGNGMAGFRFIQELLELGDFDVTVVGAEPGGAYNRARLPEVLAGTASEDSIELADPGWYAARGVRLLAGVAVTRIDRALRRLVLADGQAIRYDNLVLATGSVPAGPDLRPVEGVVAFRGRTDCAAMKAFAARGRPAVVLGGGVLGLETARALAMGGLPVTLVQRGARLMERQLDAGAARVLDRTVRSLGVNVRTGVSVRAVRGAGSVSGVELDDGSRLAAGLLVLCCGTRPSTGLASAADLAVRAGVLVDDQLRSVTDPRILAIGDCAEHRGYVNGLVAPAWAQARVAAMTVAGQRTAGYAGSPAVVRLKADGIELAALGSARAPGAEVIRFTDPSHGVYQKLIVRNGQLAGAILLGDTRAAGTLTQLFDRRARLPADRSSLLVTRRADRDAPAAAATVCECNGVSGAAISAAWQDGARNAGQIAARTRATTGCGTCRDTVEEILAGLAATEPSLVPA